MADVRQNCSLDPAVDGLAPPDSFFNPYALIQTNYSVYTYSGSLTAPPCSEIVTWNVVDTPLLISNHDFMRLTGLILDYINVETCAKGTVASPAGLTGRPLSPRNGRKITRVCNPRTAQNCPAPLRCFLRVGGPEGGFLHKWDLSKGMCQNVCVQLSQIPVKLQDNPTWSCGRCP